MSSEKAPAEDAGQHEITGHPEARKHADDNPYEPSADFAALIGAIKAEGSAARAEEQREDRGKRFREWLTIILLTCTVVAVAWQVNEMIKVYGPIKSQADAARQSADAAIRQAKDSENAMIQAERAWVGPITASLTSGVPIIGQPVKYVVNYQNTGREPATNFTFGETSFVVMDHDAQIGDARLYNDLAACKAKPAGTTGSVVYPTNSGSSNSYKLSGKTEDNFVTAAVHFGLATIVIDGCFTYKTFDTDHHSFFCYLFRRDVTDPQSLNICPIGHYAD